MRLKFLCLLLILAGIACDASAQRRKRTAPKKRATPAKKTTLQRGSARDTTIKGTTIEIIQSYKPEVRKTPKPEFATNLPPADTTTPRLDYDVPQQSLSYNYSATPLRPLALGHDSVETPYANYLKAGIGNLSTLYLDAGIGSFSGLTYETALHVQHLSQAGSIEHQKSSLTSIDGKGRLYQAGHTWNGNIGVFRNQFHHYGYDHNTFSYETDAVRKNYYGANIGIDIKNEEGRYKNLDYHPSFSASFYGVQPTPVFGATERSLRFNLPVSYNIDTNMALQMSVNIALTGFNDAAVTQSNNILQFTPTVRFTHGALEGHAGLYPTIGKGSNTYLLPDVEASFSLPQSQFLFNVGWKSRLRQNTFEQLSTRNPFMWDSYTVRQTRSDELFGGIQGNVGNHISFGGRLSWWRHNDLPMFINDTLSDEKRFLVVYDKVNALSLQASIRYQIANTFSVGLSSTWTNYAPSTFNKAWHEPAVEFKGDLMVKPIPKLVVTSYLAVLDGLYAVTKGNKAEKLNTIADLGAGAEYSFIPRLSAFLQVNNILNNKYERWHNYEAYGFNLFGGLRLKF